MTKKYRKPQYRPRKEGERQGWFDNSMGSRIPALDPDPGHVPTDPPEWMLINTTDEKKRYK